MAAKEEIVHIRLSKAEKDFFKEEAEKMGIGTSSLIRVILRDYRKKKEDEKKK